jgi:hypothetical protein
LVAIAIAIAIGGFPQALARDGRTAPTSFRMRASERDCERHV